MQMQLLNMMNIIFFIYMNHVFLYTIPEGIYETENYCANHDEAWEGKSDFLKIILSTN